MKGVALPFSAAKEWLEVVGKAFRFLGYHRFYPPVLKKSRSFLGQALWLFYNGANAETRNHRPATGRKPMRGTTYELPQKHQPIRTYRRRTAPVGALVSGGFACDDQQARRNGGQYRINGWAEVGQRRSAAPSTHPAQ